MSPILGVFGRDQELHQAAGVHVAGARPWRAAPGTEAFVGPCATLGRVARAPGPVHPVPFLADDGRYVVAADATLYYRADLARALGQPLPPEATPAQLMLAAFRKLGTRCIELLEGDFALVIWDRVARRVFCARDPAGRRPLHAIQRRGTLVVASRLAVLASLPPLGATIDDVAVGADAAGLFFGLDDATCMRDVRTVRAGWTTTWSEVGGVQTRRAWEPAPDDGAPLPFEEAATQLRALLTAAVAERLSAQGPTVVWMSGGRDSTAVFAAGMHGIRNRGADPARLIPVSRSHPVGDTGREDEAISAVAAMWGCAPRWMDAPAIPMLHRDEDGGGWRSDSFAQPFENLTRALARTGRATGATVALDGFGGDFLFQLSSDYLSDLVATGRFAAALADWRAMDLDREGWRGFARHALLPRTPAWLLHALAVARGGAPLRRAIERTAPPWIEREFVDAHQLEARALALGPYGQPDAAQVDRETRFYLTNQFFARVNSTMGRFAREEGVEIRSPLMDRRVIAFALSRPREERNAAGDQKRLLRAAMRGLLPDAVLAPRPRKTGTLATYFHANMRRDGLHALQAIAAAPLLAERGIVHRARLRDAIAEYARVGVAYPYAEALYCTLMAERWLRAHASPGVGSWRIPDAVVQRQSLRPAGPHRRRTRGPALLEEG